MRVTGHASQVWLFGILWAAQVAGQDFTISTFAGGAPPVTPAAGTVASIGLPMGIAADAAGNVYFTSQLNCVFKLDTAGILTLVAGTARWGYEGDGGPATSAHFRYPHGIALDGAGNIYIADSGNNSIRRVSPAGIITTIAGTGEKGFSGDGGPATSARLSSPAGIAVDGAGDLYIADNGNNRVRRVSPAGIITAVPGTEIQNGSLYGVAVDRAGNLYYSDWDNNWVRRVDASGNVTTVAGPTAQLRCPAVMVDPAGNLYIVDTWNHRILRQVGPGIFTTVAGTGVEGFSGDGGIATSARLSQPSAAAVDAAGNIYIADLRNHRIRRVAVAGGMVNTGIISTVAGNGNDQFSGDGGPAVSAQLYAFATAVDAAGNIYIADALNHRIRRVSPSGIITTIAGTGASGYSGDGGPATAAKIYDPWGVAVDGAGNVYIADYANARVRRVSTSGIISTVAGTGTAGFSGDGGPATAAQIRWPCAVAVDAAGSLYILEYGNVRLRRVSASGIITTVAGNGTTGYSGDGGPATSAQFDDARGVAVDQFGNIYIADLRNHRIRIVSPNGIINTLAGTGAQGFSGDGGPAASAQLYLPDSVAVDGTGNIYFTDFGNHRVRRISSPTPFQQNIITTIAGNGGNGYTGDGGPAKSAQVGSPTHVALDRSGRLYIAARNAIRMLTPTCTTSAAPDSLAAPVGGGTLALNIQAGVGCAWTITGLPAWISASANSGSGSAGVTLTVAANPGAARSATFTAAGTAVTLSQAAGGAACVYSISPASQTFNRTGGTAAIAVTTAAGCPWTAASPVNWVTISSGAAGAGNGFVNYQVLTNTTGVPRSTPITVAGLAFTVEQLGPGLVSAGSMAQVASGGGWKTTFTLVNNDSAAAMARLASPAATAPSSFCR